jgi:hypothetical protein
MKKGRIRLKPGVVKGESELALGDRYIDADKVRFSGGMPERIGGWQSLASNDALFDGICTGMFTWDDFAFNPYIALGTNSRLYIYDDDGVQNDITPVVETGTLTGPFTTTNASAIVTVADTNHLRAVGDRVRFSGASAVGGITINGEYEVASVVDVNTYTITHTSPASSGATGGGSVGYEYDLTAGLSATLFGGGWGVGPYGAGAWGTARVTGTYVQLPRSWSFSSYGQNLLACPSGWPIYEWDRTGKATLLANSPTSQFMFVTAERHVVALGLANRMQMAWSDDDDPTDWTPSVTNSANVRTLQRGSRLIAGANLAQRINIVWSDTSAYLMQYTGSNFVYDTRIIGEDCGLVGPKAFAIAGQVAYWLGGSAFWASSGSSVQQLPNMGDLRDHVLDSLADGYSVTCGHNPRHNEIWWFYTATGGERRYVVYSIDEGHWTNGTLPRSAWAVQATKQNRVLAAGYDGRLYQQEIGTTDNGAAIPWHLESGYSAIDEGNTRLNIWGYFPDWERCTGDVTIELTTKDYSPDVADEDSETEVFSGTQGTVDLRMSGRQMKMKMSGEDDFRMGVPRLEISPAGTRR